MVDFGGKILHFSVLAVLGEHLEAWDEEFPQRLVLPLLLRAPGDGLEVLLKLSLDGYRHALDDDGEELVVGEQSSSEGTHGYLLRVRVCGRIK